MRVKFNREKVLKKSEVTCLVGLATRMPDRCQLDWTKGEDGVKSSKFLIHTKQRVIEG